MKHYSIATGFQRPEWLVHSTVRNTKIYQPFLIFADRRGFGEQPLRPLSQLGSFGRFGLQGSGGLWEGWTGRGGAGEVMGRVGTKRQRGPGCQPPILTPSGDPGAPPTSPGGPQGKDEKL